MMSEKEVSSKGGIGFTGLLTIVFIVLKLSGTIAWPWFWVLSPIIFSIILVVVLVVLLAIIAVMGGK
jgi:hypothetical protein